MQTHRAQKKFCLAWTILALVKLWAVLTLPPFGDEAFYAWEALHLAWAYSDVPGATATLIYLSTAIFGDNLWGLRAPFWLTGLLIPLLVVRIARHLGDDEQAWRAGLLALMLPLLQLLGVLALPDALLTLAALASLEALMRIQKRVDNAACAQLAAALALGALSHYRFAPLLLAGTIGFFASGMAKTLRDSRVLIALGLGAMAWLPLLLYNVNSDGAGAQFQLIDRHPWSFDVKGLAHPVMQAVITTPVMYGLLLWVLWRARGRNGAWALAWWAAVIPILVYAGFAAFVDRLRFSLHWPLPAYLVAAALIPTLLEETLGHARAQRWERIALAVAMPATALLLGGVLAAGQPSLVARSAGSAMYPDNFVGWREMGAALQSRLQPDDVIVADHFMLAAQLSWQLQRRKVIYSLDHYNNHKHGRARQLADWTYDESGIDAFPPGTPVWLVFEVEETPVMQRTSWLQRICRWFPSVQPVGVVHGPGDGKRFWLYRGVRGRATVPVVVNTETPPAIDCGADQPSG